MALLVQLPCTAAATCTSAYASHSSPCALLQTDQGFSVTASCQQLLKLPDKAARVAAVLQADSILLLLRTGSLPAPNSISGLVHTHTPEQQLHTSQRQPPPWQQPARLPVR